MITDAQWQNWKEWVRPETIFYTYISPSEANLDSPIWTIQPFRFSPKTIHELKKQLNLNYCNPNDFSSLKLLGINYFYHRAFEFTFNDDDYYVTPQNTFLSLEEIRQTIKKQIEINLKNIDLISSLIKNIDSKWDELINRPVLKSASRIFIEGGYIGHSSICLYFQNAKTGKFRKYHCLFLDYNNYPVKNPFIFSHVQFPEEFEYTKSKAPVIKQIGRETNSFKNFLIRYQTYLPTIHYISAKNALEKNSWVIQPNVVVL